MSPTRQTSQQHETRSNQIQISFRLHAHALRERAKKEDDFQRMSLHFVPNSRRAGWKSQKRSRTRGKASLSPFYGTQSCVQSCLLQLKNLRREQKRNPRFQAFLLSENTSKPEALFAALTSREQRLHNGNHATVVPIST